MTAPWTRLALAAALLAGALSLPHGEAHGQRHDPRISLPPSTGGLVRTLLNAVSWRRRAEAAELLGQTGDPRVLEALATAAAHDTSPEVRRAARAAIRRIRGSIPPPPPIPGPFPPPVPQDPNVVLVDSWYQRFLGRSADPSGLSTFVGMLRRGVSADEVQAGLLASDEFWRLNGRNATGFIAGLYQGVLGRAPNRSEVGTWGRRYNDLRGNRTQLALEFLQAAQTELLWRQQGDPRIPW